MLKNHKITYTEWGGSLRCITSNGKIVNAADDLNRSECEKNGHVFENDNIKTCHRCGNQETLTCPEFPDKSKDFR